MHAAFSESQLVPSEQISYLRIHASSNVNAREELNRYLQKLPSNQYRNVVMIRMHIVLRIHLFCPFRKTSQCILRSWTNKQIYLRAINLIYDIYCNETLSFFSFPNIFYFLFNCIIF
ncbi:hypothetical protein PUN28_003961 [Cardiocondyla obscurior]|uniref:Uncharacterized protein n=1 Tax=Cardiocondyla obscurior TaxID=286306 RepID=A0AAW2GMQ7_9HYME